MPHTIRGFFLSTNPSSTNQYPYSTSHSPIAASSRASSVFNTTYTTNPSSLPSYSYTTRLLGRAPPSPLPSSISAALASATSASQMPQYPPLQYQHYANSAANNSSGASTYISAGYSSVYYGAGNSDQYNAGYSSRYVASSGSGSQSKTVCRMDCRYCSAVVCLRGMKAMLLADTSVELYSTDHPPGSVQLIERDYSTSNCRCKIRDVACRVCGNVVGYHITQPCQQCLKAPNNGHFWMFHTEGVIGQERLNMDLGKLAQELVGSPQSTGQQRTLTGNRTNSSLGSSPSMATSQAPRSEAETTRMTSLTRSQQGQQHRAASLNPITSTLSTPMASTASNMSWSTPAPGTSPPSAYAALAMLSISQFLQPMKWEQLPHPDLDIDLDPNAMGGEPLFADQWTELVSRIAEAAAANMCLALDQEEETERFLRRMAEDHKLKSEQSGGLEDEDEKTAHDIPATEAGHEENLERLIDQVDEFGLASPLRPTEDRKDEENQDMNANVNTTEWRGVSALERREQDALPENAPAPGLEGLAPSSSASVAIAGPRSSAGNDLQERNRSSGSSTSAEGNSHSPSETSCPAFALTSAMVAKAAASAAAADAAAAAHCLLYGRRRRREYDMMCR
ncbi:Protein fam72a [Gamsiella multidivaricata]|nr:Protein fam72a [Gamsiella multidivaricata]